MTRLLGAVLAGGRSSRFGSDKALAELRGKPLLTHAAEALARQCGRVIVCGRDWPGLISIADRPEADLGPLGGLNAALHYASANGFDAVLSAGCDTPALPADLGRQLAETGDVAYLAGLPIIGWWPVHLAAKLDAHLSATRDRSLRGWALVTSAVPLVLSRPLLNVNRPEDLPD